MKIISKFRDYYDGMINQGIDKEVVYLRHTEEHPIDHKKEELPDLRDRSYQRLAKEIDVIIGFCGQLYKVIKVTDHFDSSKIDQKIISHYFYSMEDFKKYSIEHNLGIDWNKSRGKYRFSFDFRIGKDIEKHYDSIDPSSLLKFFSKLNVPVFLYKRDKNKSWQYSITTNPNLSSLEFFKIMPVATCFQEVYMYVSGVLKSPDRPMVKISDLDKIHKHGFDTKLSFRKAPEKK